MRNPKVFKTLPIVVIGVIVISVLSYRIYQNQEENKLLKSANTILAILTDIRRGTGVRSTTSGVYKYKVGNKVFEYEESKNFNDLNVGDTILIEYSIDNPAIARVVNKYYMKKYKYFKNR